MQPAEKCGILIKSTDLIVTKYVYGLGLIGEEKLGCFKTYHFDMRGSAVAITDMCGNVIDTSSQNAYANNLSLTVTIDLAKVIYCNTQRISCGLCNHDLCNA